MIKTGIYFLLIVCIVSCPDDEKCLKCLYQYPFNICAACQNTAPNKKTGMCDIVPIDIIANCIEYLTAEFCSKCEFGYSLIDSRRHCVRCKTDNCAKCDKDFKVCQGCFQNQILRFDENGNLVCGSGFSNARNCSINRLGISVDECEVCLAGFVLNEKHKCVKSGLYNCWETNDEYVCRKCHYGYYLSQNSKCVRKLINFKFVFVILGIIIVVLAIPKYCNKPRYFKGESLIL